MNNWNPKQSNKPVIQDKKIVDATPVAINFGLLNKKDRKQLMTLEDQINVLKFSITAGDLKFTTKMDIRKPSFWLNETLVKLIQDEAPGAIDSFVKNKEKITEFRKSAKKYIEAELEIESSKKLNKS